MRDIAGAGFEASQIEAGFAAPALSKAELIDYLRLKAAKLSHEQKTALLKALLAVFVADGKFDESEHHALVDYTAAIGFDRQGAAEMLRGLIGNLVQDRLIT